MEEKRNMTATILNAVLTVVGILFFQAVLDVKPGSRLGYACSMAIISTGVMVIKRFIEYLTSSIESEQQKDWVNFAFRYLLLVWFSVRWIFGAVTPEETKLADGLLFHWFHEKQTEASAALFRAAMDCAEMRWNQLRAFCAVNNNAICEIFIGVFVFCFLMQAQSWWVLMTFAIVSTTTIVVNRKNLPFNKKKTVGRHIASNV